MLARLITAMNRRAVRKQLQNFYFPRKRTLTEVNPPLTRTNTADKS
jgi:hypothetical protein